VSAGTAKSPSIKYCPAHRARKVVDWKSPSVG